MDNAKVDSQNIEVRATRSEAPVSAARKLLDEARARQDAKRQARAIAKHSGGYVR